MNKSVLKTLNIVYFAVIFGAFFFNCKSKTYEEMEVFVQVVPTQTPEPKKEIENVAVKATPIPTSAPVAIPIVTEPVKVKEVEKVVPTPSAKVLLGETWVQIQFLLEKKGVAMEELDTFGLEPRAFNQGIANLDPKIWLPKLEKARADLEAFELNSRYIVKRYEKVLGRLLASQLPHEKITDFQDRMQNLMSNLEEKSLPEVNRSLNDIDLEIKSLIETR